jgi:hypothetical protein
MSHSETNDSGHFKESFKVLPPGIALGPPTPQQQPPVDLHQSRELIRIVTAKHQPLKGGIHDRFRQTYRTNKGANHCYSIALDVPLSMDYQLRTHSDFSVRNASLRHSNTSAATISPSKNVRKNDKNNEDSDHSAIITSGGTNASIAVTSAQVDTGHLFATFQHTDAVLWFDFTTLEEKALPMSYAQEVLSNLSMPYYPATFHQFGNPLGGRLPKDFIPMGTDIPRLEGVRGLAVIRSKKGVRSLWVANEDMNAILIFNILTGICTDVVPLGGQPIALYHYRKESGGDDRVYVTISGWHLIPPNGGKVLAIDVHTLKIVKEFSFHSWGSHPTSLCIYDHIAYVAEQQFGHIYRFNVTSGQDLGTLVEDMVLPNVGPLEGIALSDC